MRKQPRCRRLRGGRPRVAWSATTHADVHRTCRARRGMASAAARRQRSALRAPKCFPALPSAARAPMIRRASRPACEPMIEYGHLTHAGLRRELNEDTYYADGELGLWLVADGMGGHEYGEVASALARDTIVREIRDGTPLAQAIRIADEEIIAMSRRRDDALPMGTTVVAARIKGERFEVAWVGDSRVYLWREGQLLQLSQDHSYVQELIANGALTQEQARSHPHRNVVTQALGVTDPRSLNVETMTGELRAGMQLLLCSDGLTEEVDDRAIARVLAHQDCSAQECADTLVAAALDGGGSDNITVVLVRRA
jgi:protein phosphatase